MYVFHFTTTVLLVLLGSDVCFSLYYHSSVSSIV
jgi:hypothetical protein